MNNNTTTAIFEKITKAGAITPTTLNGLPGMSSLEIAEITGKTHGHILRDIRKMLEELGEGENPNLDSRLDVSPKLGAPHWVQTNYQSEQGKFLPMVVLDKELTFTLLSRYSFKLSRLIVKRWMTLEGEGFLRVSVQESVVHLVEREKDNRREALKRINRGHTKRPLSPDAKERNRLERQAKAYERANPSR